MGYVPGSEVNNVPFGLPLALGQYTEMSGIQKFGYNAAVGSTFETVWDGGGTYTFPAAATVAAVTSTSSADADAVIEIQGLDANYHTATEDVTVGSSSTTVFLRVFRARVKTPGTGETTNAGDVTITVNSGVAAKILAGNGQTLMAVYTVPAGCRAFLLSFHGGTSKQKEVTWRMQTRSHGDGAFNTKIYETAFGSRVDRYYQIMERFEEKTDIIVQAKADATTAISSGFELVVETK